MPSPTKRRHNNGGSARGLAAIAKEKVSAETPKPAATDTSKVKSVEVQDTAPLRTTLAQVEPPRARRPAINASLQNYLLHDNP